MLALARSKKNVIDARTTPVVFLPGIIGSRLRLTDKTGSSPVKATSRVDWDPDSKLTMATTWLNAEPSEKAARLSVTNPGTVREDGTRLPGLPLTITAPDGPIRSEHLDSDANFRADDIPRGEGGCTIVLQASTGVSAPTTIAVKDDDVLVDPGVPFRVELATARHHRLIVVEGKTELLLLDTAGKPVKNKRCRAVIDGRTREGLTDRDGTWVVRHLRNAEICRVEFPGLQPGG